MHAHPRHTEDGLVKLALTFWEEAWQGDPCTAHTSSTWTALLRPQVQLHPGGASHWCVQPVSGEKTNLLHIHLILTLLLDERAEGSTMPTLLRADELEETILRRVRSLETM